MTSSGLHWSKRLVMRDVERGRCMTVGTRWAPSQMSTMVNLVKLGPGTWPWPGTNPRDSTADWGATAILDIRYNTLYKVTLEELYIFKSILLISLSKRLKRQFVVQFNKRLMLASFINEKSNLKNITPFFNTLLPTHVVPRCCCCLGGRKSDWIIAVGLKTIPKQWWKDDQQRWKT